MPIDVAAAGQLLDEFRLDVLQPRQIEFFQRLVQGKVFPLQTALPYLFLSDLVFPLHEREAKGFRRCGRLPCGRHRRDAHAEVGVCRECRIALLRYGGLASSLLDSDTRIIEEDTARCTAEEGQGLYEAFEEGLGVLPAEVHGEGCEL